MPCLIHAVVVLDWASLSENEAWTGGPRPTSYAAGLQQVQHSVRLRTDPIIIGAPIPRGHLVPIPRRDTLAYSLWTRSRASWWVREHSAQLLRPDTMQRRSMTREVDGLGVLVAIPEHCRRVMVSFLSLEGLGNLRRVSKAFLKIVARTPQWQWDAALTRLCNVNQKVQCMNCYAHPSELTAATCEECEEVMSWPNADPRFSEGFRLLSAKEKFCTVS